MPGFLDRLLKRFSPKEFDLPFDPAPHLRDEGGFLRPDWPALTALVEGLPEEQRRPAWGAVAKRWLREQAPLLHPSFAVHESENLVLLTALTPGRARLLLEYAEGVLKGVQKDVPGESRRPLAILHFRGATRFGGYMAPYGTPEMDWSSLSGLFLGDGYPRVVLKGEDQSKLEALLPRQLTRAAMDHLELPPWLREGVPLVVQARHARDQAALAPEDLQPTREFWGRADMQQQFWSGAAFANTVEAYFLALLLTARLMDEHAGASWRDFLQEADPADGGVAAARKHLGREPADVAAEVLTSPP